MTTPADLLARLDALYKAAEPAFSTLSEYGWLSQSIEDDPAALELIHSLALAWRSGELRRALEDSVRMEWIDNEVDQYGDGYTEPLEAGWHIQWQQRSPKDRWPGVRAWIDAEIARRPADDIFDTAIDGVQGGGG